MMSRTPPTFTPGSYEPTHFKRARAGSISGRLRSASDLCDDGIITPQEKGMIKDLIITGDPELERVLETYEQGNPAELQVLLRGGALARRRASIDLADDLDLGVLNVGSLGSTPGASSGAVGAFNFDDIPFNPDMDEPMAAPDTRKSRADSFSDVLGASFGLGGFSLGSSLPGADTNMTGRGMGGGTSTASAAAAAASTATGAGGFPFGASPVDHTFGDDLLGEDDDGGFPGFSFPDVTPVIEQQPRAAVRSSGRQAAASRAGSGGGSGRGSSGRPPRTAPSSSRAVSAPIGIPGMKGRSSGPGDNKIGAYSPESRRRRIERFLEKRKKRVWTKKVKYDVRKNFADSRLRVKGRFVKKEDEALLRELIQMT